MTNLQIVGFCVASLALTLGLSAGLYPAALPARPNSSAAAETARMRTLAALCATLLPVAFFAPAQAAPLTYADAVPTGAVVIDTRPQPACATASLPGARCLAPDEVLGGDGRLASFRDVLWALGTLGLDGTTSVAVAGDDPVGRDFVAGLLYLSGQREVSILTRPLSDLMADAARTERLFGGEVRAFVRSAYWKVPMRDGLIVLRDELQTLLAAPNPPVLLDGRAEGAAAMIEGARSLPDADLRRGAAALPPGPLAVYADGPLETIAYFAHVAATTGAPPLVYIHGRQDRAARAGGSKQEDGGRGLLIAAALALGAGGIALVIIGRKRRTTP